MSYQVLARKWRPTNFKQMVGQEHVLQALVHALDSQRLHHAYLFTGTRGVGKTTIARILARCLSCEEGVTSEPCGRCGACSSIEQGRYVDLIEIDAASRTKVEDMRELLENVQYAPTEGRFKIYLIDEVHMLSTHSFNALLKTLEEPPEHVKFLFATTDPQKLPITILSRCLQFNLKNMTPEKIVSHLKYVLSEEQVGAEENALWSLARAADGSMRDALSLTDQAIAYTQGQLKEALVTAMLGTVDQKKVYRLLNTLVARDAKALLHVVADLSEFAPDYASILEVIVSIFHRVAVEQAVPGVTDNSQGDQDRICFYAQNLSAEDVQLYYQVALTSRKDLAISPDARAGFEMALLRMMAFQMAVPEQSPSDTLHPEVPVEHEHAISQVDDLPVEEGMAGNDVTGIEPSFSEVAATDSPLEVAGLVETAQKKTVDEPVVAESDEFTKRAELEVSQPVSAAEEHQDGDAGQGEVGSNASETILSMEWPRQAIRLGLAGMTHNLLMNMVKRVESDVLVLAVESGHFRLLNDSHKKKISQAIQTGLEWDKAIEFVEGLEPDDETPAMWRDRMSQEKLDEAKRSLLADPNVKNLIAEFDGRMLEDSVVALSPIE